MKSEALYYNDAVSGAKVTKWTNYFAHQYHLYFTNLGWYDQNQKLLFCSDRGNGSNLYSLDLQTGVQQQLTEYNRSDTVGIQGTYINPQKNEAYFIANESITALNLDTQEEERLFKIPAGYQFSSLSCTADGKSLCFGIYEDLSSQFNINLGNGYVGFEEIEAARPVSKIYELDLTGKRATVIHEESRWITHINTSPTQANLLTFCHEGPWDKVDHRIWVLNRDTKEVWPVREGALDQYAGHEYWHADGLTIGYHGFTKSLDWKEGKFLGHIRYDNTNQQDYQFPYQNMHVHSNDTNLFVGDGQQNVVHHGTNHQDYIFLWKKNKNELEGPRILCRHRGSFHSQKVHVHPRISPDGKEVLYTSDAEGYGDIYSVEIPPFEELPLLEDK